MKIPARGGRAGRIRLAAAATLMLAAALPGCSGQKAVGTTLEDSRRLILAVDFACDEGAREELERWSARGYARACYGPGDLLQGRWIAWEEGYLNIDGLYRDGEKDGEWKVFNQDGSLYAVIRFDMGRRRGKNFY